MEPLAFSKRAVCSRWLLVGGLIATGGCRLEATSDPSEAATPSRTTLTDPMQIAGRQMPSGPNAVLPEVDPSIFPMPGATEFETAKQVEDDASYSEGGAPTSGGIRRAPQVAAGEFEGPSMAAPPTSPGMPGTPAGASVAAPAAIAGDNSSVAREIVEADVVQAQGDILYVLNRYRGLLLVDMSDPDAPLVAGRVPFQAQPVDMYLQAGKAYIVMSDYFSYWQFDGDADPRGFHGSQVLVVDVVDPTHPEVAGSFAVDGEVTDTRIVGEVLYAVSKRNPEYWRYDTQDWHDTTWVLSIDISDPAQIKAVDKAEFPGAATVLQVYQTALSIAAIDPNYFLVDDDNTQQTLITYVDISDPKGKIGVGGTAYVPGMVADKFKMDLDGGYLRIISQNWYWRPDAAAALTIFDARDPSRLVQSAQIPISGDVPTPERFARTQATRFAGPDLFTNLCWYDSSTFNQVCRMDLYDVGNPERPEKVRELPVDGAITHFEVRGKRLLALGTHNRPQGPYQVQVALFDIGDLRQAQRLSAVDLGGDGSGSEALSDYKAFKVLDELEMVLLPLSWQENTAQGYYQYHSGAQIIDWKNDQLVAQGRIAQGGQGSYVERAIAFHDRIVSISTSQIQVIDASDRSKPIATANLFLVRNVVDVFQIGGYEVQLGVDEEDSSYRFYVLPFGEDDMHKSIAELDVGGSVSYQIQNGAIVHVMTLDNNDGAQVIRNADFSDPSKPRWRGSYRVPDDIDHIYSGPYYNYWSFYDYYWNPGAGQPVDKDLLPVTTREVKSSDTQRRFYRNYLRVIDLRDADNPHLAQGSIEMPDWPFVNRATTGKILFSTHTEPALDANGNPKQYHERYFLDRVDASDPDNLVALPKLSIPGRLIDIDASGTILYTVDYQWDEYGRRRNSFDVLKLDNDTAELRQVMAVGDEIDRGRYLDREVWLSSHSYPWWGRNADSPDSRQPYTRLTRLRFDKQAMLKSTDSHDIPSYHFDLLDVVDATVYLASSYPTGLLILDTGDFDNPTVLGAARTVGYVSKILPEGDYLYTPMGSYGVRRIAIK